MLEEVLMHLHNWFRTGIYPGTYTIQNGGIDLDFLQDGQYFRICGSLFHDGLYQYGSRIEGLKDEVFTGTIWALAIPKTVIELAGEIAAWQEKYKAVIDSPYTSESFGGYSYSKASGAGDSTGSGGWQAAFRGRLNPYRKLREM